MRLSSLGMGVAIVGLGLLSGGGGGVRMADWVSPEEALLKRRIEGLRDLLAAARRAPLAQFEQTLIVIDERLVDDLLRAATPIERVLQEKYRLTLDQTNVDFEDGFALVKFGGRVSLVDDAETFADIKVYGGLDVVELDRKSGILRGRLKIIAVDVQRVDFKGLTAPLRRLVEDLGRTKLSDFEALLSSVEIPIRLQSAIEIPGIGPEGGVKIAALTLPLRASIESVKAFRGKLWINVGASTAAAASPTPPASPGEVQP
jgi:hypothetical protein